MAHHFQLTQLLIETHKKNRHVVASLADLKMALCTAFPDQQDSMLINSLRQFDVPVLRRWAILGDIFQEGGGASYEAGNTLNKQKHVCFSTFVIQQLNCFITTNKCTINFTTDYFYIIYTPTCFDISVSSSGRFTFVPC